MPAGPHGKFVRGGVQGESDMLSVPPVRTTSASPSLISCAALMIVWKPLPHNLSESWRDGADALASLLTDSPVDGQGRNIDRQSRQVTDMPSQVSSRRIRIQHLTVSRERDSRARGFSRGKQVSVRFRRCGKDRARTHAPKDDRVDFDAFREFCQCSLGRVPSELSEANGASRRVGVSQRSPIRQRRAGARARTCEAVRLLRLPPKAPNAVRFAEAM